MQENTQENSLEQAPASFGMTATEAKALYYSGRLYYNPSDTRMAVGRYTPDGGVIFFKDVDNINSKGA